MFTFDQPTIQTIVLVVIAAVPSFVAWIRLGPRVSGLEDWREEATSINHKMELAIERLVTLQESTERRIARLEQESAGRSASNESRRRGDVDAD